MRSGKTFSKVFITFILMLCIAVVSAGCGQSSQTSQTNQQPAGNTNANNSSKTEAPKSDAKNDGAAKAAQSLDLVFGGGVTGGTLWPMAVQISDLFQANISEIKSKSIVPGGLAATPPAIEAKKMHMGFSTADASINAIQGKAPYNKKIESMSVLINLQKQELQIAVKKDSKINRISDLKGKRMTLGIKGTTTDVITRKLFEFAGFTEQDARLVQNLGFQDGVEQMKNGQMDAYIVVGPSPYPFINDLSLTQDIRIIPVEDELIQKLNEWNKGILPITLPAGVYKGVEKEIKTVYSPLNILIDNSLDQEMVYTMVKTIVENQESLTKTNPGVKKFTKGDFFVDYGVPYHPGVKKYLGK